MLFQSLLKHMIREGTLRLEAPGGRVYVYGNGHSPRSTIKLHRRILEWTIGLQPELKVAEAYMDGDLTVQEGTLRDFLSVIFLNLPRLQLHPLVRFLDALVYHSRRLKQFNPVKIARKNVAFHYDLPTELYDLFLDSDRQYSCGYFTNPLAGLEQAQYDKKKHIASKLYLNQPGLRVLDIGSGWGGLGLYLAHEAFCNVTGVTLSVEQHKLSQKRAQTLGLDKVCLFALRDYRQEEGPYDRIVSVGMFEHVGKKNYDEFFMHIRRLLTNDGVCLLHSIGRFGEGTSINPFMRKHIFPGADLPSLSEVLQAIERSGLYVTDIEILRLHYAETLKHWTKRFQARRAEAAHIYDERFCRKWEFYLIGCELSFRTGILMVFQLQLTKKLGTLPITRNYMMDKDERLTRVPDPLTERHRKRA